MLDPNPSSRISIAKIIDSSWFKKSSLKTIRSKEEQEFAAEDEDSICRRSSRRRRGGEGGAEVRDDDVGSSVISKLEEVGKTRNFSVKKSESCVRLQGLESGRKGKLGIAADIFSVTPSFVVVEVKKLSGDTLEYNQFCSKELRPALKDIVWTTTAGNFVPTA
ncbi:CBL-interacting serine/threonine-protein kinase 6-like [Salvia miltiorrhiza]|uniref:CBL-interacting serine/threonine-protein kinase 6-like n=1 Tax=Salvia miltiorrhiza TaxID=226208 RepID=UPI0025AD0708|nr:CBL-interacting serine/threonine-protein kinase 6-like [Salvia miltiorrhiza]